MGSSRSWVEAGNGVPTLPQADRSCNRRIGSEIRLARLMRPGLRPLTTPAFRRLAAARVVDELGDWLGEIALAVLVFDRTGSPMATAGLFLALQFAPALATPPLVARIEPYRSRVSLSAINVLLALVFVILA